MRQHLEGILWTIAFGGLLWASVTSLKVLLLGLGVVSGSSLMVVVPLHFYRAWRRASSVPNQCEYAVWVGLETLFALGLVSGCVYMVSAI